MNEQHALALEMAVGLIQISRWPLPAGDSDFDTGRTAPKISSLSYVSDSHVSGQVCVLHRIWFCLFREALEARKDPSRYMEVCRKLSFQFWVVVEYNS